MLVINYSYSIYKIRKTKKLLKQKRLEVKFSEHTAARIYGYVLVLTNISVSISSDGQRHFDLI